MKQNGYTSKDTLIGSEQIIFLTNKKNACFAKTRLIDIFINIDNIYYYIIIIVTQFETGLTQFETANDLI